VLASAGNENKVFLSTADGVYVSADAGETFTKVSSTNYPTTTGTFMPASHLKVSPASPARMMLQIQVDTWTTFKYYSHNGGATWAKTGENTGNLNYLPFNGGRVGHGLWHPTDPTGPGPSAATACRPAPTGRPPSAGATTACPP
jgi:hypothetical protein